MYLHVIYFQNNNIAHFRLKEKWQKNEILLGSLFVFPHYICVLWK
jgi:hypothetical protein